MRFLSLCSGMEAASVAWGPLGWKAGAFSEIEPACCDLLAHRYLDTPNIGDMMADDFIDRAREHGPYDLICGGTPCQAFSVAGKRGSLDDARGNLTLRFVEICDAIGSDWIVWENVPGVLNTADNAFGCFIAGLVGESAMLEPPGGKWTDAGYVAGPRRLVAWRVLDAQYFGLAQRRRRVFVVGVRAGIGVHPGQVLFEPESLRRHTPPSREKGQEVAGTLGGGSQNRGWCDDLDRAGAFVPEDIVGAVSAKWSKGTGGPAGDECYNLVAAFPQDPVSSENLAFAQDGRQGQGVAYSVRTAQTGSNGWGVDEDRAHTLDGTGGAAIAVAFTQNQARTAGQTGKTLDQGGQGSSMAVRRLTPL